VNKMPKYYAELGVTPQQLASLPKVTPALNRIMQGLKAKGQPSDYYYYLEACGEPNIRKIMAIRERIGVSKPVLEVLCVAAGVDPSLVLTCVLQTVDRLTSYNASARFSAAKEQVADALIETASIPGTDGDNSRSMFMKATGLLPQPKGAQTVINMTQNAPQAMIVAPPPEKTIRRFSDLATRLQLPSPEEARVFTEENPAED